MTYPIKLIYCSVFVRERVRFIPEGFLPFKLVPMKMLLQPLYEVFYLKLSSDVVHCAITCFTEGGLLRTEYTPNNTRLGESQTNWLQLAGTMSSEGFLTVEKCILRRRLKREGAQSATCAFVWYQFFDSALSSSSHNGNRKCINSGMSIIARFSKVITGRFVFF